ncbi:MULTISPECIES: nuclear transport factor 2 family protein [unclassified Streptomyces]|uniref:nuclear transport factor 2 family protein n=1 Tax=unclassified Streptomyces TaxID=2593676 RepID=UPI002DDAA4DA|nr:MULTISPECIES: nuclear transport factor 2 family protein [unclassified Streptomyces]WSA94330.1 nuclear transport factor 2 family protein [Streptomyces sp. NBC_01795]WSB78748.1 nuclear transport factor 2 family protein [Streptomyces sp. NBC_01775]WSS13048.1 nuclear transport factor 2 family protein [Streptomyces sp. NBC_01186]WSS41832.1 nuclear transport factor 2 family protein [Streptomyces sp. NBC_01187]
MPHTATPAAPPEWVSQIMSEIDTLSFGEGFAHLTDETEMYFGTAHVVGAEAIKAFFVKIDEPLDITHEVLEFWTTADGVCFLRGEATMAKKTEPGNVVRAPFMHIYYLDEGHPARVRTLRITAGPLQTDAVL